MASEIRANKQTNRVGLGTVTYTDTGIIVSGISSATNFKTGSSNLHSTGLAVGTGDGLTFVHSTGINLGTGVTFSNNGNVTLSGIITATTFVGNLTGNPSGSGANLTNIPAGNLTGTVADARISTLTASKLTGALPAISGANLTNLPPSAPVGGATTNTVFFENAKEVAVNYQITSTKNAMSAGPIAINAGIAVTVPSGCAWTIV